MPASVYLLNESRNQSTIKAEDAADMNIEATSAEQLCYLVDGGLAERRACVIRVQARLDDLDFAPSGEWSQGIDGFDLIRLHRQRQVGLFAASELSIVDPHDDNGAAIEVSPLDGFGDLELRSQRLKPLHHSV